VPTPSKHGKGGGANDGARWPVAFSFDFRGRVLIDGEGRRVRSLLPEVIDNGTVGCRNGHVSGQLGALIAFVWPPRAG
jgi:hypothetical protein